MTERLSAKSVAIVASCVCVLLVWQTMMMKSTGSSSLTINKQQPLPLYRNSKKNSSETQRCSPKSRLVFLKTHKTGSSTMATIFERYGYSRKLTFALSVKGNQVLSRQKHFNRKFVLQLPGITDQHFDLLTNHARYQRKEMEAVVPNATYITILRRPEDQLESVLGYFEVYRATGIANESNPLGKFMDDPLKYYEMHTRKWEMLRNGMLHDLGFDPKFSEDTDKILQTISKLDEEFDLVLLTEYFDESLVLMKKMLCWGFDDILYLAHGVRSKSHRVEMTESLREKIRKWSHGDALLYEHFNKTFWNKVAEYGSNFRKDLDYFITLNQAMTEDCVDSGKFDKHDQRIDRLVLKNNSELCNHLLRDEPIFTRMIRKSMIRRFGKTD